MNGAAESARTPSGASGFAERSSARRTCALAAFLVLCSAAGELLAQEAPPREPAVDAARDQDPDPAAEFEGEVITELVWRGLNEERSRRYAEAIYTKRGAKLRRDLASDDLRLLWRRYKVRVQFQVERHPAGGIKVIAVAEEVGVLEKLSFTGNRSFTRTELLEALGLSYGGKVQEEDTQRFAERLREHYREKGHHFVGVTTRVDTAKSELVYEILEGPRVYVLDVRFHGNEAIPSSRFLGLGTRLHGAVESSTPFFIWPFRLGGQPFVQRRVDEDRVALARLYRSQGYYDAEVSYDIQFSDDGRYAYLDFFVEEGRLYKLRGITIEGNHDLPTAELLALLKMKPGDPVTEALLSSDIQRIVEHYGKRGYPMHFGLEERFDIDQEQFANDDGTLSVVLRITEGRQRTLERVEVRGNDKTRRPVILRELLLDPGQIVDSSLIARSIARLESLRYFESAQGFPAVYSDLEQSPDDPDKVTWVIEVEEGRTGQFNIGGGLGSNSGPFLSFTWTNQNFGLTRLPDSPFTALPELFLGQAFSGDGQALILEASPGLDVSRYSISFREPDLFGLYRNPIGLDLALYRTLRVWRTHLETRTGYSVGLTKDLSREWQVGLGLRDDAIEVDDIDRRASDRIWSLEGMNHVRGLGARVRYRDLDVPMQPTEGWDLRLDSFFAGALLPSDFDYWTGVVNADRFFSLGKDERGRADVLALSGSFGLSDGYGSTDEVPYFDRFFLGGLDSLRGFNIRGAGPVENGLPVGGQALWTGSVEYRFPLVSTPMPRQVDEYEWVRGFAFTDFGGLGLELSDPTFRQLRASSGLGVRIRVPFLPTASLEFSLAYPWLYESTDDLLYFQFRLSTF
ncbi:MAG: outer membrane protein assembly factor [Planctomycetes bacterium]|nr:outer membrane protein assembly factor [Planctomycetota bacterium]